MLPIAHTESRLRCHLWLAINTAAHLSDNSTTVGLCCGRKKEILIVHLSSPGRRGRTRFREGTLRVTRGRILTRDGVVSLSQDLFGCVVRLHVVFLLREDDVEDGVGAAAGLVHVGRSHSADKQKGELMN